MQDALSVLQAAVTKVASFNSTGFNLVTGTGVAGLVARVVYSAASTVSGTETATFTIEHSANNSTWYTVASAAADVVTLSSTVGAGEIFIPFRTDKAYVRLVLTIADLSSGNTPTITYSASLTLAKP